MITEEGVTRSNVYRHPASDMLVLDMLMLETYGPEWLVWESETIEARIKERESYGISGINLSKLEAARTMHMVDAFWERWEVFVWCTMPINGVYPDFETMQVPTVTQCMISVGSANKIRTDVPWSEELRTYLATVHRHDEVLFAQPPLDFVRIDTSAFEVDAAKVKALWPMVKHIGPVPESGTAEGEQLERMREIRNSYEEHQREMRAQLKAVLHG